MARAGRSQCIADVGGTSQSCLINGDKAQSPQGLPLPLPIRSNETLQLRWLPRWFQAGNVAGDSDKVTTRSSISYRGGGNWDGGAK